MKKEANRTENRKSGTDGTFPNFSPQQHAGIAHNEENIRECGHGSARNERFLVWALPDWEKKMGFVPSVPGFLGIAIASLRWFPTHTFTWEFDMG
jgi:hypothetical protein